MSKKPKVLYSHVRLDLALMLQGKTIDRVFEDESCIGLRTTDGKFFYAESESYGDDSNAINTIVDVPERVARGLMILSETEEEKAERELYERLKSKYEGK